ncbi:MULTISPECIES: PucR family transcriptional regulator [Streptomyces]|uniref:PucR family transcriptional regulator n=1 Tax=Streptomyces TaxID=1883 RepID=UPI000BC827B4|nr:MULTISPECIES: PucR family transcriptional regulator [Streptomyces]MDX2549850.1 helix-turn-helix domain-containing protein [Streptomyces stelliscabiei]MDX2610729.1 helix-turn-helix domain-containing protein [Streptomyces stelliscabiei]MDX2635181.1 helix-turn-helix domain-containing protein [Streptomyces stelliscabiei]MDX2660916.1 helix-turn-helix domain-containing protein [Streptomyces stelliscabiei]MDX2710320.1 helix-turn-helix domain-containing protein [Streptomyces stelliscabiei]
MPDPTSPTAPAVPPTPPVPLSALLAHGDLGLRQIAGPVDTGTAIHGAHTSEMPDPYPYLLGGELLLTAGVHIPETAGSGTSVADPFGGYLDAYVARVVAAGGAALGFGVAPVHDSVPGALVAACDAHGLPLIEVPPGTTFSGVARAVWQLMARARHAELRRVAEAQQGLAAAASRPDPVRAVLRQLARRLSGRAVLYGPEGTELASYGGEYGEAVHRGLAALATVVRPGVRGAGPSHVRLRRAGATSHHAPAPADTPPSPTLSPRTSAPTSGTDTVDGVHLATYALGAGHDFTLGVASPHRTPGDHTIASVAAVLLSLLTGERQSGTGAARTSALVRLLLGAEPQEVAPLLGTGTHWHVVHARPAEGAPRPEALAAAALGAALGSALVDVHGDDVRVLVPADRDIPEQPGWTCGVSAAAEPHAWPTADVQAARALARARATRTALVRHGRPTTLAQLVPTEDATAHALALLAPLTAAPGGAALVETLRTWLSLHGSWDRTAVALTVHRNTVRQRIARCATLLDTDLDDPDVRMELWFALRQG